MPSLAARLRRRPAVPSEVLRDEGIGHLVSIPSARLAYSRAANAYARTQSACTCLCVTPATVLGRLPPATVLGRLTSRVLGRLSGGRPDGPRPPISQRGGVSHHLCIMCPSIRAMSLLQVAMLSSPIGTCHEVCVKRPSKAHCTTLSVGMTAGQRTVAVAAAEAAAEAVVGACVEGF